MILYTSGTTGRPKGAVNTHRNIVAALGLSFFHGVRMAMFLPPQPDAPPMRSLVNAPLFHVSGLHMAAIANLVGGVRAVWTTGRFDPETVMRIIEADRITHWSYTATMLHRVVSHPKLGDYDLSSLRSGGGGGSTFSPALQQRAKAALPNLRSSMGVGYGQTECAALATLNSGEELNLFPESAGRPLPTVQLEIRDESGAELPEGEEGEIHLRGPDGDARLLAPPRGQRGDDRARPLAEHRRHRPDGGRAAVPLVAPARPHHPRRREHLPGRDREPAGGASRRWRRSRWSRSSTRSWARR